MENLILLNNTEHQHLRICPEKAEAHGAKLRTMPVVLSEFMKLAVQYPIVLTKKMDTGQFVCVSMFGFDEKENLFWQNNSWDAIYVPLQVARQPFFLGLDQKENNASHSGQHVVCFDADSESLQQTTGEALFDEAGRETPYLQQKKSILAELLEGESNTQCFTDKLLALDLLQPMRIEITFVNGDSHRINGLYTIDEEKLSAMPAQTIVELHGLGYLTYIYNDCLHGPGLLVSATKKCALFHGRVIGVKGGRVIAG